jgi:hypothetical protein
MKSDGQPLYWSRRGEIACEMHAPKSDLNRWTADGWRRVDRARRPLQCAQCHDGASVKRSPRDPMRPTAPLKGPRQEV